MIYETRIGIDLGGTKIEGVVLKGPARNLEVVTRERIPTESEKGYDHIKEQVLALIRRLEAQAEPNAPVGVGMPGSVTRQGLIKNSNTLCLNGTRFRQELRESLGREIVYANDANCFALAEARLGAGKGYGLVFGVIMGTGTGGGVVIDGQVREGPQSIGGEWGHMTLHSASDIECYCGKKGCVENYLAGPWVEGAYARAAGEKILLPGILKRREAGEPAAVDCIETWLDSFGRAIANVINLLDPDAVVLGGGVSNVDCLYTEGRDRAAGYIFSDEMTTPILRHKLGDTAGVLGAALLTGSNQ